jgi:hypothetical protein
LTSLIEQLFSNILYVLVILSSLGVTVFELTKYLLGQYSKWKQRQRVGVFERKLAEVERSAAEVASRDLGVTTRLLPVRVIPTDSTIEAGIRFVETPETTVRRIGRVLKREKPAMQKALVLHVRDFEIDSAQASPETQEDIIKWTIVVNTQRRSREYFPTDIADAIVKRKTEEVAFELINLGKVSSECIEVAEHEDVDPKTYRKISILNGQELSEVQQSVSRVIEKGPSHIHDAREEAKAVLNRVFANAVKRKIIEATSKLTNIPEDRKPKAVRSAGDILREADESVEIDPERALEYAEQAEGVLKASLEDIRLVLRKRVEVFPVREPREVSELDWSQATLAKSPNVGRYSKRELDTIKAKFGKLTASDVAELRYRFGVILAYVYSFPGSTPNEIAENTALLQTTVAAEIHFLERFGYVRALTRADRLPRKCYPNLEISTLVANASAFLEKQVLLVADNVAIDQHYDLDELVIRLTENGSSMHAVTPKWLSDVVRDKMKRNGLCVGVIRRTSEQERIALSDDYVIQVDDPSAVAIQQSTGFEVGMQVALEAFLVGSAPPAEN